MIAAQDMVVDLKDLYSWGRLARASCFNARALAKLCRISTRQLARCCQDRLGRSPQDWLDEQRIVAAKHLLLETHCVKQVAFQLGFKQVSHFCRQFKYYLGVPATEFLVLVEHNFPNHDSGSTVSQPLADRFQS